MKGDIDSILDDCLKQSGATVEESVANYLDEAAILRPLLEIALEVQRLDPPQMSPVAFAAGKQLMLAALAEKRRRQALSRSPWSRVAEQMVSLFRREGGLTVRWGRPVLIGALATVTVFVWVLAWGLGSQFWSSGVVAQTAVLADSTGLVQIRADSEAPWESATTAGLIEAGGRIHTGKSSATTLTFFDGSTISVGPETEITVSELGSQRDGGGRIIALYQWVGHTHSRVKSMADSASRFEIETASAVAVVHGTEFEVDVAPDGTTEVIVLEGVVEVTAQEATVLVPAGQATTVLAGEAPGEVVSAPVAEPTETVEPGETAGPADTPTSTRVLPVATGTPVPPMRTSTPVPPAPTNTATPVEVMEIFLARYRESGETLTVKARSSRPGCTLTLVGFGPMEPEGDHWVYVVTNLAADDAPTTVAVLSSCGGSHTSPVEWK
jgi:hypothetical protein